MNHAETIDFILELNKKMTEKYGLFYSLYNANITCGEIGSCFTDDDYKELFEKKILEYVDNTFIRASKLFLFKELPIFSEHIDLINQSYKAWFQGYYVLAYNGLMPAVEGILRIWNKELNLVETNFKPKIFAKKLKTYLKKRKLNDLNNPNSIVNEWNRFTIECFSNLINFIFENTDFKNPTNLPNRHTVLHSVNQPTNEQARLNVLKLIPIIDLIAEIYLITFKVPYASSEFRKKNSDKYPCSKPIYITEEKYQSQILAYSFGYHLLTDITGFFSNI